MRAHLSARAGEKETVDQIVPWEKRQTVPVTLAHAYDSWCMAEIAKELKRPAAEIAEWERLAKNYRLLWKSDSGFFHPKDADGKWISRSTTGSRAARRLATTTTRTTAGRITGMSCTTFPV